MAARHRAPHLARQNLPLTRTRRLQPPERSRRYRRHHRVRPQPERPAAGRTRRPPHHPRPRPRLPQRREMRGGERHRQIAGYRDRVSAPRKQYARHPRAHHQTARRETDCHRQRHRQPRNRQACRRIGKRPA